MKRWRLNLLGAAAVCAWTLETISAQNPAPIRLPADPSTPVIVLEDRGYVGFANRKNFEPVLTIRADGSVIVVEPLGDAVGVQGKISADELRELLHFVIEEQGFFILDPKGEYEPLPPACAGFSIIVNHAKIAVMRVQTADRRHETKLDLSFRRTPIIQIRNVEERLRRVAEEIKGGGAERVREMLGYANETLAIEYPEAKAFLREDFVATGVLRDGEQAFVFLKTREDGSWHRAVVADAKKLKPEVRILTGVPEKREPVPAPASMVQNRTGIPEQSEDVAEYLRNLPTAGCLGQ